MCDNQTKEQEEEKRQILGHPRCKQADGRLIGGLDQDGAAFPWQPDVVWERAGQDFMILHWPVMRDAWPSRHQSIWLPVLCLVAIVIQIVIRVRVVAVA